MAIDMAREKEKALERSYREGARRMAMELWRIFDSPHDYVHGNTHFIMGLQSCAETCRSYAEMDDPIQWLEDLKAENEMREVK